MEQPSAPGGPRAPSDRPCQHGHSPYAGTARECFGQACVSYFDQGEAHVLVLRGELDWRSEHFVQVLTDQARRGGRPLVVDLSAVTHLHIDVLAQLLAARTHPGISLLSPLPPAFLKIAATTGTTGAFTLHSDLAQAVAWSALRQTDTLQGM